MKRFTRCIILFAGAVAFSCAGAPAPSAPAKAAPTLAGPFKAITVMTFAPEGTLFVGDSGTGKVHALTPPAQVNPAAEVPYNLKGIDAKIAALLGTTRSNVRVRDLAIHPKTKEAYLAVGRVTADRYDAAIVVVNQNGNARLIDPKNSTDEIQIPFAPAEGFAFYGDVPARSLTFTDLEFHQGTLYIAGLSNADFASSLWTTPVPFGSKPTMTTVEIYHAGHNQQETRAPIRTMKIASLNGVDHLIAAYTCTPLVVFPLSALADGAHVKGTTIAELGYGNTPGDLLTFTGQDMKQNTFPVLFLNNKNQAAQVIAMQAVAKAAASPGLAKPVMMSKVDLGAFNAPMTSVLQIDDQSPMLLAGIRRDVEEGDLELVSYMKNAYFRLTDFQSEYEVPGYTYPSGSAPIREFQNAMKRIENKAEFVKK